MTSNQVTFLKNLNKDSGRTDKDGRHLPAASSVHYLFHDGITFRNENDFIFFDDDNQLVHCISANADSTIKQGCPFSLFSASYDSLMYTQANLTLDDLKYLLANMFSDKLTEDQSKQIIDWAKRLPVNPISVVIGQYTKAYNDNPGDYNPITPEWTDRGDLDNRYPVQPDNARDWYKDNP